MPYNVAIIFEGIFVSNLLLITDVARLRDVFVGLTDDKTVRLRIANNLEKGAEEIANEKPDIVFVQTHLSGLSADILIMHLKKQLGRKRSSFVLLASPNQVSETILAPYKGWLDTSLEDGALLTDLRNLLTSLTTRAKRSGKSTVPEAVPAVLPDLPLTTTPPDIDFEAIAENNISQSLQSEPVSAPVPETAAEASLEEQGITYSPRPRLTVYSEFNSSFDNAVSSTPAPEFLTEATPTLKQDWAAKQLKPDSSPLTRSKSSSFALWLAPVIIAVVVATVLQQRKPSPAPEQAITPPTASAPQAKKPPQQPFPEAAPKPVSASDKTETQASVKSTLNSKTATSVIPIPENPVKQEAVPSTANAASISKLPDFIPRYGFDKNFSAANPGWERYKGQVTEFKVYRESQSIKAIQVIDRGGRGVPESFMKGVLKQVANKPVFTIETTEKKDGYEIQRGHLADNLKVVYYRDANGGKLRAFVINWQ